MKLSSGFRTKVILLNAASFFTMLFAVFAFFQRAEWGIGWFLMGIAGVAYLIYSLFKLINEDRRQIADFLMTIRYEDFIRTYPVPSGDEPDAKLYAEFNAISDKFRHLRSQNEANRQLMQMVLENVDTGIFCMEKSGTTLLANRALKAILHKSYFRDIETFKQIDPALFEAMKNLPVGERIVQKVVVNDEVVQLAIRNYVLKSMDGEIQLFTFFNLSGELTGEEIRSYHKLISILSHEIMNSVTPIASLSQSAAEMVKSSDNPSDELEDVAQALEVIQKRSSGLLKFTENYRKLTKIPQVSLQDINLEPFFQQISALFKSQVPPDVSLEFRFFRPNLQLSGDPVLLEQVMINLVKNALEAVKNQPGGKVLVLADRDEQMRILIRISDNGPGIEAANMDQIFVPFYTTKADGSGIGLSLARQIMRQHQGDIQVVSEAGKGAVFTLVFMG
jgi:two-component system, NtrC family, nitrogen regulation sensor histidine kinase NtrY